MPEGSEHPPPPPPSGYHQAGVAPGSAGRGVTWSCGPQKRPWRRPRDTLSLILLQPPQPVRPPPPSGKLQEQPRCSHVFSSQVLSPLCSPPSDVLCNQLERQPSWSQGPRKSWRKHNRLSQHPPPLLLPSSLALRKAQRHRQKDAGQMDGSRSAPRLVKGQRPSAFPWPGHQRSGRRLAQRLTIKAFSAITFKLHISSGPPTGVGTVSLPAFQGSGNLTLSEFAGTERNLADLSPSLAPNHTKLVEIQERDLPKDTGVLIRVQRREASLPTSSEDLLQEEDGSKPSVRAGEPSQPSTPRHSFKAGPCQSAGDASHTGGVKEYRWKVWGLGLSKVQLHLLSVTQFPCVLDTGGCWALWAFDPASSPLSSLPPLPA